MEGILAEIRDGIATAHQQLPVDKAALDALNRLQAALHLRKIDLAGWAQDVKTERTRKERNDG